MLRPKGLHPHLGITRKPSRSLSRIPSYRMWTSLVWLPLRHPKGFLQPPRFCPHPSVGISGENDWPTPSSVSLPIYST